MQSNDVAARIEYVAPQHVRDVLAALGRTEDVKFSPSNRRLAIAGLLKNKVAVFDISITVSGNSKNIALTNAHEISSSYLQFPHGVDFIDDEKILVANRGGQPCIFDLSTKALANSDMEPLAVIHSDKIATPGSVRVVRNRQGRYEALICNNSGPTVTRHLLNLDGGCSATDGEILFNKWLELPDSISLTKDMEWFAVSSHDAHNVLLYKNIPTLNGSSDPDGMLRCCTHPHGLTFTSDGRFLLVADADAPFVHIYERDDTGWQGVRNPLSSFRVLNDEDYLRGHFSFGEGGPKGVDINDAMNILVTTCTEQPLAFFDLPAVLEIACSHKSLQRVLDQKALELKYELDRQAEANAKLLALRNSKSWRITAPLRWISASLRKLSPK